MRLVAIFVAVVAGLSMLWCHHRLDVLVKPNAMAKREGAQIPTAAMAHAIGGGFDKLIADFYWLAFIQYTGEENNPDHLYSRAFDYINLISTLDPYFTKPYWYGCWTIGFLQHRPDLANKVLQWGMEKNPKEWDLAYLAGINAYLFARDYKLGAHYYRVAASRPDAPADFLNRQATILDSGLPEMVKQKETLEGVFYHTHDPNLRIATYRQLLGIFDRMYKTAPTAEAKLSVQQQLKRLMERMKKYANE